MANEINFSNLPRDKELANKLVDNQNSLDQLKTNQGVLGKLWGASSSVPNNIAGFLVCTLVLIGILYTFVAIGLQACGKSLGLPIPDFWAIITPLITLSIGYLFGDKKSREP